MIRPVAVLILVALSSLPAEAQVFDLVSLDHLNNKFCGRVVDYTSNHGEDRRICSPILGRKRDLYVYLPPGYDPSLAYPLIVYLHGADSTSTVPRPGGHEGDGRDDGRGEFPPAVIAGPDGTTRGEPADHHSLWVNGLGGRFEDHLVERSCRS